MFDDLCQRRSIDRRHLQGFQVAAAFGFDPYKRAVCYRGIRILNLA